MRVLVAPSCEWDMPGPEVIAHVRQTWRRQAPQDDVVGVVLLENGHGYMTDGTHTSSSGPIPLDLSKPAGPRQSGAELMLGSSYATGLQLVRALTAPGTPTPILVGAPGGHEWTQAADGGAGLLAAIAEADSPANPISNPNELVTSSLLGGGAGLGDITPEHLPDLNRLRRYLTAKPVVLATATTTPLLGLEGLAASLNRIGRLNDTLAHNLERGLGNFGHAVGQVTGHSIIGKNLLATHQASPTVQANQVRDLTSAPRTGASGGIGFILHVLGAQLVDALEYAAQQSGLDAELDQTDVVMVIAPTLNAQQMHNGTVRTLAERALQRGLPVIVLTTESHAGRREWSAIGISAVYEQQPTASRSTFTALLERIPGIARTWSRTT